MVSHEIALILVAWAAGSLLAYKYTEPCISYLGTKGTLHFGFLVLVSASYAFWLTTFVTNDA